MSDSELRAAFRQAVERAEQSPGPEEEPIPLVEVHRTPSNGSWLGMVRRRITGSAEDGEAADLTVRLVSLPKERQSGRGSALKATLVLAAVLLVWLVGLKILDQPRFSRTRGHAYAVRTLDTLYDVSTGLPYAAADTARYLAGRTSAGLSSAAAHPAAGQFASSFTSARRRLLSAVDDVSEEGAVGAGWRRRLAGLIGGSKFGTLGGGEAAEERAPVMGVLGNPTTMANPGVQTQAGATSAGAGALDSGSTGSTTSVPLGFGVGAKVGSMPGGQNVPSSGVSSGVSSGLATSGTKSSSVAITPTFENGFMSSSGATGMTGATVGSSAATGTGATPGVSAGTMGAATGSTGTTAGSLGAATGSTGRTGSTAGSTAGSTGITAASGSGPRSVPGVTAGGSSALGGGSAVGGSTSTSATVNQGTGTDRSTMLAPGLQATPAAGALTEQQSQLQQAATGLQATPAAGTVTAQQPQQQQQAAGFATGAGTGGATGFATGAATGAATQATPGPYRQNTPASGVKSGFASLGGATSGGATSAVSGTAMDNFAAGRRLLRH